MTDPTDNVTPLPITFKEPPGEDEPLLVVQRSVCLHLGQYLVHEAAAEVTCAVCGEKLNPMWVLARLARDEARQVEARQTYQEEMKRLAERSRTKCQHCGQMTRISRR